MPSSEGRLGCGRPGESGNAERLTCAWCSVVVRRGRGHRGIWTRLFGLWDEPSPCLSCALAVNWDAAVTYWPLFLRFCSYYSSFTGPTVAISRVNVVFQEFQPIFSPGGMCPWHSQGCRFSEREGPSLHKYCLCSGFKHEPPSHHLPSPSPVCPARGDCFLSAQLQLTGHFVNSLFNGHPSKSICQNVF